MNEVEVAIEFVEPGIDFAMPITIDGHHACADNVIDISAAADFTAPDTFLTAKEAAEILPLHPVTILRWAREGRLPHIKLGRKVIFPLSQLTAWLEAQSGYTDSAVRAA